jgi:hypothetical protein
VEMRKWLRQQSEDFCAVGFNTLVKWWDKCISVDGRYIEKLMFFPGLNVTCFTFYIHLWPIYWLSLIHSQSQVIWCCATLQLIKTLLNNLW